MIIILPHYSPSLITLTLYDPHLASVNTLNISVLLVGCKQMLIKSFKIIHGFDTIEDNL